MDDWLKIIAYPEKIVLYANRNIMEARPYTANIAIIPEYGQGFRFAVHAGSDGKPAVSDGLMCYYPFDGNASDRISQKHGELVRRPDFTGFTPSKTGKAIHLTEKQSVKIPHNVFLSLSEYSISFWIKNFGMGMILSAISSDGAPANYPRIITESGMFKMISGYDAANATPAFNYPVTPIQDGNWRHIVITCRKDEAGSWNKILYVDGKRAAASSSPENNTSGKPCQSIEIGGTGNMKIKATSLEMDNLRFYNRALTDADVDVIFVTENE